MDAITLLKKDHSTVEQLFKRYEKAGDRAYVEKRDIVDRIIEELSRHAAIEEQLFYPAAREHVDDVDDIALESMEEHHIVKWELAELERMDPRDERFDAKVTVLIENVRHHVEEEESDFFPKVRDEIGRKDLGELGDAMEEARSTAPTHPHPRSPQTPPANFLVGALAGTMDRLADTASGVLQGSVNVTKDLVNRLPGISIGVSSPTGSSVTRRAASRVRDDVNDAVDTAASRTKRTATTAGRGASRTVETAAAGAKGTATSARKGVKNTRSTAKRGATSTRRTAGRAGSATRAAASGRRANAS